tara:strand:+ start:3295 stop:3450 length:156 start_codon:yes stop_codon:yes gene_type:complete
MNKEKEINELKTRVALLEKMVLSSFATNTEDTKVVKKHDPILIGNIRRRVI